MEVISGTNKRERVRGTHCCLFNLISKCNGAAQHSFICPGGVAAVKL